MLQNERFKKICVRQRVLALNERGELHLFFDVLEKVLAVETEEDIRRIQPEIHWLNEMVGKGHAIDALIEIHKMCLESDSLI